MTKKYSKNREMTLTLPTLHRVVSFFGKSIGGKKILRKSWKIEPTLPWVGSVTVRRSLRINFYDIISSSSRECPQIKYAVPYVPRPSQRFPGTTWASILPPGST
jgi:hypothetical protein